MQPPANGDSRRTPPPPPPLHHHPWPRRYAPPPPAAMVMQQHIMGPPPVPPPPTPPFAAGHFVPYHQPPTPPPLPPVKVAGGFYGRGIKGGCGGGEVGDEENRTIWVGDLHYWMDENYLYSCFGHTGEVAVIKLIRNKQTWQPEGYGFVEFFSHTAAERVLQNFNGHIMPNTDQQFRLNWASFSMGDKRSEITSDHSIFVGDLASDVTDSVLQETFANKYSSVKGAKVVIDANTGRSKGYGFVRFGDENQKKLAITEMNGVYCSTRPMRIGLATPRKSSAGYGSNGSSTPVSQSDSDSSNSTVFVGGLDPEISEDDLKQTFSQYGEITSVKIPAGKQCGFVLFVNRTDAEAALQQLNGTTIGKQTVRLSWGRNPANKQSRGERGSWNSSPYYGGHYNGYGYALPPHYPGMYAAAYGAYAMYGNQQQVS